MTDRYGAVCGRTMQFSMISTTQSRLLPLIRLATTIGIAAAVFCGVLTANIGNHANAAEGGTLTMALTSDIKTLDPHRSTLDVFRHTIRSTVFEALVFVNPETLETEPRLAVSWDTSPDGRATTFKLREGVRWHDGSEFTAEDVAFSIRRIKDPDFGSELSPQVAQVDSVDVIDPLTVRINLSETAPAIVANLARVQIVSEKSISEIDTNPIGTGPFTFVEWSPGDRIRVEQFADYYLEDRPILDAIEWRIVTDSQARVAGLRDGSFQILALVEAKDVKQVEGLADVEVITTPPVVLYENFNINTTRPPFDDKRVRQALAFSFDRESYVKTIWFGLARASVNPFPPEMPAYLSQSNELVSFDLEKAASLLSDAGFSESNPLKMEILTPVGFDSLKSMALILQDSLNRMGHQVTVRELEVSVWIDRFVVNPDYDITTDNFNTVPEDPTGIFNSSNLAPGTNVNLWNPAGYSELVASAAAEIDPERRIALYQDLQRLVLDEMPQITIDHVPLLYLSRSGVSGLVIGPSGFDDYSQVSVSD